MLDYEPETIDALRGRLPDALKQLWDADKIKEYPNHRPMIYRTHVFDLPSGVRLGVSRETSKQHGIAIHISASWTKQGSAKLSTLNEYKKLLKATIKALFGVHQNEATSELFTGMVMHYTFTGDAYRQICDNCGITDVEPNGDR